MGADFRLTPARAKRKHAALEAIKRHYAARGKRPSYAEIGGALDPPVTKERARELVAQLLADGDLVKVPGQPWTLPRAKDRISRGDALQRLAEEGVVILDGAGPITWPLPIRPIPTPAALDHIPDIDWSGAVDGGRRGEPG